MVLHEKAYGLTSNSLEEPLWQPASRTKLAKSVKRMLDDIQTLLLTCGTQSFRRIEAVLEESQYEGAWEKYLEEYSDAPGTNEFLKGARPA